MTDMFQPIQIGTLMMIDTVSPKTAAWLNQPRDAERGDITAQNVIWIAIAAAGAFAVSVILYNKFKTKATNVDLDAPGALPTP